MGALRRFRQAPQTLHELLIDTAQLASLFLLSKGREAGAPARHPTTSSAPLPSSLYLLILGSTRLPQSPSVGRRTPAPACISLLQLLQRESEVASQLFCRHSGQIPLRNGHVDDLPSAPHTPSLLVRGLPRTTPTPDPVMSHWIAMAYLSFSAPSRPSVRHEL